jgi:hypothetical protein
MGLLVGRGKWLCGYVCKMGSFVRE